LQLTYLLASLCELRRSRS